VKAEFTEKGYLVEDPQESNANEPKDVVGTVSI
jgi:hypothetical protein